MCLKLEPLSNSAQLRNEISALEKLRSCKGVPRILCHGIVEFRGCQYCSMVTGKSHAQLSLHSDRIAHTSLQDLQPSPNDLPQIVTQVIHILQNIHEHGLSHNDIKPDHIVFDSQGPFLIDFGACTELGSEIPFVTQKFCPNRALLTQESVCSVFLYFFTLQDPTVDFVLSGIPWCLCMKNFRGILHQ